MNLKEWTLHYIRQRDAFEKSIISIDETKEIIKVKYKDKEQNYLAEEKLSLSSLDKLKALENKCVVCEHSRANLDFLINNWKLFSEVKDLTIIFVNEQHCEKWVIKPYVHNLIADNSSLKQGLESMFYAILPENSSKY